jgi:hypothetical protein
MLPFDQAFSYMYPWRGSMRIPVIFPDHRRAVVSSEDLQELIQTKKIKAFFRSTEYVCIALDPVRGMGGRKYTGPERRGNLQNH